MNAITSRSRGVSDYRLLFASGAIAFERDPHGVQHVMIAGISERISFNPHGAGRLV
jgi:hypothetical protein